MYEHIDHEEADILHGRVMTLFCEALEINQSTPMVVLDHLATALGKVYREVADAHARADGCVCGWEPSDYSDMHALQHAMSRAGLTRDERALTHSSVIGHA